MDLAIYRRSNFLAQEIIFRETKTRRKKKKHTLFSEFPPPVTFPLTRVTGMNPEAEETDTQIISPYFPRSSIRIWTLLLLPLKNQTRSLKFQFIEPS